MISCVQFTNLVLIPALQEIDLYSENAKVLLQTIMAHESNMGQFVAQYDGGPALGFYQMEPNTFDEVWNKILGERFILKHQIMKSCNFASEPLPEDMVYNLKFATQMARAFFLRIKAPLPDSTNIAKVARYAKLFWDTPEGKATDEDYIQAYKMFTKEAA